MPPTALLTLVLLLLVSTTSNAAPVLRTNCHCSIIPSSSPLLTARETDLLSTTTAKSADPCTNLGSDLEYFRVKDPDLYRVYVNPGNREVAATAAMDSFTPVTTAALMELAAEYGIVDLTVDLGSESGASKDDDDAEERLVCHSDASAPVHGNGNDTSGLWMLQGIVGITVMACIVECIALGRARSISQAAFKPPPAEADGWREDVKSTHGDDDADADTDVLLDSDDALDADILNADILNADIPNAELLNADLLDADIFDTDLLDADLLDTDVFDTDVLDADFLDTDLLSTDTLDTTILNTDMLNADMLNVDMLNADLLSTNVLDPDMYGRDESPSTPTSSRRRGKVARMYLHGPHHGHWREYSPHCLSCTPRGRRRRD